MKWNRTAASEWGCIVGGLVAAGTFLVWAFGIKPRTPTFGFFPVLSVLVAFACAVLFYLGKRLPPSHPSVAPAPTESDLDTAGQCKELKQMADDDAAKIQERVRQIGQRVEFHFAPGSDPYIDIITNLCNCSVFDLMSFGEIMGHGIYAGKQLAGEPRIIVSVEPVLLRLKHGEVATLVMRQFLSTEVADAMWTNRNRLGVDFRPVAVTFKVLALPGGLTQLYRWWGPLASLEEAKRV